MKDLLTLGKALSKTEQRLIKGGKEQCLLPDNTCSHIWIGCAEEECQPQPYL